MNTPHMELFNGIKIERGFILMNNFYEILDLLYRVNKKYPELSFCQIMNWLFLDKLDMSDLADKEIINRLEEILKDE